jgi:hypothetical protein
LSASLNSWDLGGSDDTFVRICALSAAELQTPIATWWSGRSLLYLQEQLARLPYEFSNVRAFRNSLASIAAVFKRVLVASRGA